MNYTDYNSTLVPITCKTGWKISFTPTNLPFTAGFMAMPIDGIGPIIYTQKILLNGKVVQENIIDDSQVPFNQIQYTIN